MESKQEFNTTENGIWRETQEDGFIQFRLYSQLSEELEKKGLKDVETDESGKDKLTLNLTKPESFPDAKRSQRFKQNSKVYCKSLQDYVQIKSFDELSKKYTFRLMKQDPAKGDTKNLETTEDDLTEWIQIQVKGIISKNYDSNASSQDFSVFKVNINDKVQKISDILESDELGGYFMYDGKYLDNTALDESFQKLFIKDKGLITTVVAASGKAIQGIKWYRFPPTRNRFDDYCYMSNIGWDACCFVPKKPIKFMGFGLLANYKAKDISFKIQWIIDGVESAEHIVNYTGDQIDEKWKSHHLDIRSLGEKYISCNEGSKIVVKCMQIYEGDLREDTNRVFYGHSGYERNYSKIEGQEYDFDMTNDLPIGHRNQNSTGANSGQFSYIYYI